MTAGVCPHCGMDSTFDPECDICGEHPTESPPTPWWAGVCPHCGMDSAFDPECDICGEPVPPTAEGSSYDPETGITTTGTQYPGGFRTVIQTDRTGQIISSVTHATPLPPPPSVGAGVCPHCGMDSAVTAFDPECGICGELGVSRDQLPWVSYRDPETGITTTWTRYPDGSKEVTQTDRTGRVISSTR